MKNNNFSVGEKIIDSDGIYVIFKIDEGRIHYRPVSDGKNGCTGSIPIDNLIQACIRPLMSKAEIKLFWENLTDEKPLEIPFSNNSKVNNGAFLKDILYLNNPSKTAKLLIYLAGLKKDLNKLSYSDQAVFDQALNHIVDEISVVTENPSRKIQEKILKTIER